MTRSTIGIFVGLLLGLAFVLGNFGDMLIVALFAIIGCVVAKVLDGDIDISQYVSGRRNSG
jgi:hypothetical protein